MKILVIVLVCLLLFGGTIFHYFSKQKPEKIYQGPVRPTDDEKYFRTTGITKPLEVNQNANT